jgi:hypothetical protein
MQLVTSAFQLFGDTFNAMLTVPIFRFFFVCFVALTVYALVRHFLYNAKQGVK